MRDAIRCCVSCILPCGALDVIRIVHASGRVEEISCGAVSARDIMRAYPKHVLRKPPSISFDAVDDEVPKAVTLPPEAELRRGEIYFLVPVIAPPETAAAARRRRGKGRRRRRKENDGGQGDEKSTVLLNERYLTEILSEKASSCRDKRRGRVGVWRPHLDTISEGSNGL